MLFIQPHDGDRAAQRAVRDALWPAEPVVWVGAVLEGIDRQKDRLGDRLALEPDGGQPGRQQEKKDKGDTE